MAALNIKAKDFQDKVLESDKYVLVDFWAEWCVPCKMMAPVLEELTSEDEFKDKLEVDKVDIEDMDNQLLAFTYQIQSIPNMKLFKNGSVVKEFVGFRPKEQLKEELKSVISNQS